MDILNVCPIHFQEVKHLEVHFSLETSIGKSHCGKKSKFLHKQSQLLYFLTQLVTFKAVTLGTSSPFMLALTDNLTGDDSLCSIVHFTRLTQYICQ